PRRRHGWGRGEQRRRGWRRGRPGRRQGDGRHRARRATHLGARGRCRLRRARRATPRRRRVQLVGAVAGPRQRVLDRVVIGYSALGNRGLIWVVGGVAVALVTQRWWAIPLVAAVVWITLGINFAIKRCVRRAGRLELRDAECDHSR